MKPAAFVVDPEIAIHVPLVDMAAWVVLVRERLPEGLR